MKFVLSGVETNNKGAELMLYAILQEIERKYPDSKVYVGLDSVQQGLDYIHTSLELCEKPVYYTRKWFQRMHLYGIARRLHIHVPTKWFQDRYAIKGTDYFIDGSGFAFSDQWNIPEWLIEQKTKLWEANASVGAKLIFLPQALGPFTKEYSRRQLSVIAKYASVIMPREKQSYQYIQESGLVDMEKVWKFADFTSLVKGTVPSQYEYLRDSVCVIPNLRMIDKGAITMEGYVKLLSSIIKNAKAHGHNVFLLNHEGKGDEELAYKLKDALSGDIAVFTGLNALEVKGLISISYLVISSRFHGVASALNSCVPCLATSWSFKYAELFNDYKLDGCILPLDDPNLAISMIEKYLDPHVNESIRNHLIEQRPHIQQNTREMWDLIWNL